jgi:hypothetical protein
MLNILECARDLIGTRQIGFGKHDNPLPDLEQTTDLEVFPRLGLDGFVGRDDEQNGINSSNTRKHVFNKSFVARNINEADLLAAAHGHVGESEINRNAALFLFR